MSSRERFRIIERLLALGDPEAEALLAAQSQADPSRRRAALRVRGRRGAARCGGQGDVRSPAGSDDRALPESWIEESLAPFNTVEHAALTAPYLERALARLPQLKRERKIFFVNHWLAAFLGGQTDAASVSDGEAVPARGEARPGPAPQGARGARRARAHGTHPGGLCRRSAQSAGASAP